MVKNGFRERPSFPKKNSFMSPAREFETGSVCRTFPVAENLFFSSTRKQNYMLKNTQLPGPWGAHEPSSSLYKSLRPGESSFPGRSRRLIVSKVLEENSFHETETPPGGWPRASPLLFLIYAFFFPTLTNFPGLFFPFRKPAVLLRSAPL